MAIKRKTRNRRFQRRHVLDVKLRASHRRQIRLRRLVLLLLFLGTVFGGGFAAWRGGDLLLQHFVYRNPAFTIDHLEIQTDGVLSRDQVVRWAGVKTEENLFALDLARVKRDLELVPAIESVVVERVLPHKLRIRITERDPIARVVFPRRAEHGGDQLYLVDRHGIVIFPLEPSQVAHGALPDYTLLPLLFGPNSNDLRPGRRLTDEHIQAALQFLDTFSRSALVGLVRLHHVDVRAGGVLQVRTVDDCQVSLSLEEFEGQLRRWKVIYDHGRRAGRQMASVDLSVSNNVPVRWRESSMQTIPRGTAPEPSAKRKNV